MVRLKINLLPLSLSGTNQTHFAFLAANKWQIKLGMLGANLNGYAAEGSLGAQDKGRNFGSFGFGMSAGFHALINFLTESTSCVSEMASRFGGKTQPSQNAQRVASGR